jgi:signal transduction histidine kinase
MDRLILGILDLSRVARAEIVPVEVDMTSVVLSVWEELLPAAERERYQFILPPLPPVRGDALLLRQVWVNLLSNAAKYSARSRTRRIEVGSVAGAGEISFFVKDSGAGFDPESASKLFGLFQRLHTDADFEGLGIGLATVRHIIHRHGGQVHAEGRPQEGATFSFTRPTQPPRHAS